jgi:hypothetical protein
MGRASDTERGSLLRQPIRRGCGSGRQPLARCRLAAHGAYHLRHGRPGPSPFQASRASRHLGALSLAQTPTDFRFWISPWSCSLSDGAAGLIGALRDGRCSSWNTAAALPDPRAGIPKPADCHLSGCGLVSGPLYDLARLGNVLARSRHGVASRQERRETQEREQE